MEEFERGEKKRRRTQAIDAIGYSLRRRRRRRRKRKKKKNRLFRGY